MKISPQKFISETIIILTFVRCQAFILTFVRKYNTMETEFKNNLKFLRQERGLGQVELAKHLGVSKGIISLWENGLREPSLSSLVAIAKFFHVGLDELVGIEDK